MSKGNRSAREMLEKIYGKKCMIHEGIRTLRPPTPKKSRYKGESIASQLTYHHLRAKRHGGDASVENGAVLCRRCHDWLEQLSAAEREKVNNELRRYKKEYEPCTIEFVDHLNLGFEVRATTFTVNEPKRKYDRAKDKQDFQRRVREWEAEIEI